ncbi:MAG TPA: hypothetical protein DCM32_05295, partial [Xanthomonadaceae bacterium]|nr:hypothetical protein [Xanthomonadaceae bacterium]
MTQRLLKLVAAPLLLSLALVVAMLAGAGPAIEWVLLLATSAAWGAALAWIAATGGRSRLASRMIADERALLGEL